MTYRTAIIISKEYKGYSPECSGPGRVVYGLAGHNCSTEEFAEWLLHSSVLDNFIVCAGNKLIGLGGEPELQQGELISISFDEYFNHWLQFEISTWRRDVM